MGETWIDWWCAGLLQAQVKVVYLLLCHLAWNEILRVLTL